MDSTQTYSTPSIVACLFLHSSGARDAGWGDMGAQRHEAQGAGMEGTERYTNAFILGTCLGGLIEYIDIRATQRARPMGGVWHVGRHLQ